MINASRFAEPLPRGSVEHSINTEQELSVELLRKPATAKEGSLETYLNKQIASRKGIRPFRVPNGANAAGAHRWVRRMTAEGVLIEPLSRKRGKNDVLSLKISKYLFALQQELLATEGWPSAALQQEARDAFAASTPAQEDSPEIRAYLERIWGPLKYPSIYEVPWTPFAERRTNPSPSEFCPESR